jgi:DNA-binding NarL/FixJ family response regulator
MIEGKKIRLMIVDDLKRVRQDLKTALELVEDFVVVSEAVNGNDAIQKAERYCPDVVLIDLKMPVMGGFEAVLQMKNRHLVGGIVMLTIYDEIQNRHQAQKVGVDAFLVKGTSMSIFEKTIRQVWMNSVQTPSKSGWCCDFDELR